MTDSKVLLDSSVWLGYFLGNTPRAKEFVDSDDAINLTSAISIHEIYKKINKLRDRKAAEKAVSFIEENSIIIGVTKETAVLSARNCEKYGLHTIDGLIYSTAMLEKAGFITADNDFRKTPKTTIISGK